MKGRKGYTLVEVMISMLLTAVMVGAVFSIAITGQQSTNKIDHRVVANQYSRHLTELLAQYNTADYSNPSSLNVLPGPSSTAAGPSSWQFGTNQVFGEDNRYIQDDCGTGAWPANCYVLSTGSHTLKGFLPQWFEDPNGAYKATVTYFVPAVGSGSQSFTGGNAYQATVSINWTEP